jgi:hypothetical protein
LFCVSYRKGRRLEYVVRDVFRRRAEYEDRPLRLIRYRYDRLNDKLMLQEISV